MSEETGLRKMVESGLAQAGVTVERLYNCSAVTTAGALVAAGQGIAALSRLTMAQLPSTSLVCRPLVDPAVRPFNRRRSAQEPIPVTRRAEPSCANWNGRRGWSG